MNISLVFRNRNNIISNLLKINYKNILPKHRINNKNTQYVVNFMTKKLCNITPTISDTRFDENLYISSENRFIDINILNNSYIADELSSIIIDYYFSYELTNTLSYRNQYDYLICNINILTQLIYYVLEKDVDIDRLSDFSNYFVDKVTNGHYKNIIPYKNLSNYIRFIIRELKFDNNSKNKLMIQVQDLVTKGKLKKKDGEIYYKTFEYIFYINSS